jgi:copper chaperone NosL
MTTQKNSRLSKGLLFIVAALFAGALFVPMWRIELQAPQYPEGLVLQLYANKIGGDVAIINGLNHYIGMSTLHTENFPEFKILPILFGVFSFFSLLLFFIGRRSGVAILLLFFTVFILISAVDFYRWNYQYGHNLDPNAAIKVPGMAYQPPLIGYKQLLNFGAYSVPDTGGWLLIAALVLLCFIVAKEFQLFQNKQQSK